MMARKNIENRKTTVVRSDPREGASLLHDQVRIQIIEDPGKKPGIHLSLPPYRHGGRVTSVSLRDGQDLKDLVDVATEAYRELVGVYAADIYQEPEGAGADD